LDGVVAAGSSAAYATNVQLCFLRLCALLLLCATGCRAPIPQASTQQAPVQLVSSDAAATVTDIRFPSPALGGQLWYRVIVPNVAPGERLPVLYLLPGGKSNPADTQERANAVQQAIAQRLIVVSPDSGSSWYSNAKHAQCARWEDAITRDLVRDVESRFPVLAGRQHRGLAGVSMGGYGAVKLALKHPDLYAFAASMGGAFDVTRRWPNLFNPGQSWSEWIIFGFRPATRLDEDVFALLDHAALPQSVKWFASCGSDDSFSSDNTRLLHRLRERGASVDTVTTPGAHNWQTWNNMLPQLYADASESLR
jgi:S-formylglutathione hydrolase FrmB